MQLGDNGLFKSSGTNGTEVTPTFTIIEVTQTEKPTDPSTITPSYTNTPDPTVTLVLTDTPGDTNTPTPTQIRTALALRLCEVDQGEICIYSVGTTASGLQFVIFEFPSQPDFGINIVLGGDEDDDGDEFGCISLANYPNRSYCTGPLQPTLQDILLQVYRSEEHRLFARGSVYFLPPTPTPSPTTEPKVDCFGDECDDLLVPTP
jgi:hypothetical protein